MGPHYIRPTYLTAISPYIISAECTNVPWSCEILSALLSEPSLCISTDILGGPFTNMNQL